MAEKSSWRRRWRRRLIIFGLFILAGMVFRWWTAPRVEPGSHLLVDLSGNVPERAPTGLLAVLSDEPAVGILDILAALRDAAEDDRVDGLVLRVRSLDIGWARAQEIRQAVARFRESDKPAVAYLEQELMNSMLEYYVASAAEKVYVPPAVSAPLSGLLAEVTFFGGLWEKLDVNLQVEQIGPYKSMGDIIARREMSDEHREMMNWLLDGFYGRFVADVAAARGIEERDLREAIDGAPTTAGELEALGLVDGEKLLGELRAEKLGPDRKFLTVGHYQRAGGLGREATEERRIAYIRGLGTIHTGDPAGGPGAARDMAADAMVRAFDRAREDESVAAIVFRIDSPGGSALASDLVWGSVSEAAREKPVIVSMGDVAASGGYYVASAGTRILAQPGTLTGSIGVVLMKPDVSGLLHKAGIETVTIARGKRAEMGSLFNPLDEAERERVVYAMEHVYQVFLDRVAQGRSMSADEVDRVGQGRVWTGDQAVEQGLVDEIGGIHDAFRAAKEAAGIPTDARVPLVFYPKPEGFLAMLGDLTGARVALPPLWRELETKLAPLRFPRGSILTLMPQLVEIR